MKLEVGRKKIEIENGKEMEKRDEFDQIYIINIFELLNNIFK